MADTSKLNLEAAPYNPNAAGDGGSAAYKRSGKTKTDLLKKYRSCIDTSRKWRKDEGFEQTWSRLVDLYRGKQFTKTLSDADQIAVNIAFSTVNVIVPSVAVNYPTVTVMPRDEMQSEPASTAEAAVNYWWRHFDWRQELKRSVKDSLIFGHGWIKVGWKFEQSSRDMNDQEVEQQFLEMRDQAQQAAAAQPEMAAQLPTDDEILEQLDGKAVETSEDRPFVERVSPFDMYVDPEATCIEDLKWVAQRIVLPLEDVKADGRYSAAARKKLKPDASTNPRWRDDDKKGKYSDDVQRVTLWEYYDVRHKYYCVFAESGDGFLLDPTDFPYPFGIPYRFLPNYEVPDQFYPIGDLEMLEPLQHELNAVRSDMANHRKRYSRAYLVKRDKLDDNARAALQSNDDNRIVYVDGDEDLNSIVVPIQQVPLDPNMYQYSEQVESDVDLISGVSEYQRGAMSEIRRTATEASMIQDAANARSADKLAQIEIFMRDIARNVVMLAQQYLSTEDVARIVGPDGAMQWVPFDIVRIQGEFDFEVEAGSTQPHNEQFRRQQAMQLATSLQPYVGMVVDPTQLVIYVLKEGFGVKNPERFLMMQDPMAMMGGDPSMMGGAPPDEASLADGNTSPESGPGSIPPAILTQLQGQVGLDLNNQGG
jgi:hypothetical protein